VSPPPGSACGQTINVAARRDLGPGPAPLAIGDSILYDAAEPLAYYGFQVNAMVCRTMAQGIDWLAAHQSNLPVLVVVALGTNGGVTDTQIDQLLSILGPERLLAMVTPRIRTYAYVPALIRAAAGQHPGRIVVLDWARLSAGHPGWFAPDGIHLGGTAGINAYTQLLASSLLATPTPAPPASAPPSPTSAPPPARPPAPRRRHVPERPLPNGSVDSAVVLLAAIEALSLSFLGG
jgi:hypothetical protein